MSLSQLGILLILLGIAGWLWHSHGRRERALALVRAACVREDVLLLDDNVAFRRLFLQRSSQGQRHWVREFTFEFTVTGEQRHAGRILLHGERALLVELAPHPLRASLDHANDPVLDRVIQLDAWRQRQKPPSP